MPLVARSWAYALGPTYYNGSGAIFNEPNCPINTDSYKNGPKGLRGHALAAPGHSLGEPAG